MRAVTVIAAILALVFSLLPTTSVAAEPAAALRWAACPDTGMPTPGLECTTLAVPMDYRNPRGATISLAVSRLPSTNPARRRGIVLMNPGGPGGSGLAMPVGLVSGGLSAAVRES